MSELLEGETLRERLHGSPLPVRKAIDVAIQIAQGLAAAHERGIVHERASPGAFRTTESGSPIGRMIAADRTLMSVPIDTSGPKLKIGEPQALFPTRAAFGRDPFDVSADGQRFLILTLIEQPQELITVVLNWAAALKN